MKKIGEEIRFGRRRGHVVAHATFKRHGHAEEVDTYYIVDLDPESSGYMQKLPGAPTLDSFISMMIVHVGNEDDEPSTNA